MIKINLLPLEKRRAERTPMPRFMLLLTTVAAACVMVAYLAYVFIQITSTKSEIEEQDRKLKELAGAQRKHKDLKAQEKNLNAKLTQIGSVTKRNVEFYKTLDALWDVVDANPKIWLDNIRFMSPDEAKSAFKSIDKSARTFPQYGLQVTCHAAGHDATAITQFRKDLVEHKFLGEKYDQINFAPEWSLEEEDEFAVGTSMNFGVLIYPKVSKAPPKKTKKKKKKK